MDITLITSELLKVPCLTTPVRQLFNEEAAIAAVTCEGDVDKLLSLLHRTEQSFETLISSPVDTSVMRTHAKIVKPFVSNADLEDDFI